MTRVFVGERLPEPRNPTKICMYIYDVCESVMEGVIHQIVQKWLPSVLSPQIQGATFVFSRCAFSTN